MQHQFVYPRVSEMRINPAEAMPAASAPSRPCQSQRDLVVASLLRRPDRSGDTKASQRLFQK
jgi:hypothetical protein